MLQVFQPLQFGIGFEVTLAAIKPDVVALGKAQWGCGKWPMTQSRPPCDQQALLQSHHHHSDFIPDLILGSNQLLVNTGV